jgi:hypothetical protein
MGIEDARRRREQEASTLSFQQTEEVRARAAEDAALDMRLREVGADFIAHIAVGRSPVTIQGWATHNRERNSFVRGRTYKLESRITDSVTGWIAAAQIRTDEGSTSALVITRVNEWFVATHERWPQRGSDGYSHPVGVNSLPTASDRVRALRTILYNSAGKDLGTLFEDSCLSELEGGDRWVGVFPDSPRH